MVTISTSDWKNLLGFVPTREAQEAATATHLRVLEVARGATSLKNDVMQRFLLTPLNSSQLEIIAKISHQKVIWLFSQLGGQLLTLLGKEVRPGVSLFITHTLVPLPFDTLNTISIKGKKSRFRDWRDIASAIVKELPRIDYPKLTRALPKGWSQVTNSHELVDAAGLFRNCAFSKEPLLLDNHYLVFFEDKVMVLILFEYEVELKGSEIHGEETEKFYHIMEANGPNNASIEEEFKDFPERLIDHLEGNGYAVAPPDLSNPIVARQLEEEEFEKGEFWRSWIAFEQYNAALENVREKGITAWADYSAMRTEQYEDTLKNFLLERKEEELEKELEELNKEDKNTIVLILVSLVLLGIIFLGNFFKSTPHSPPPPPNVEKQL